MNDGWIEVLTAVAVMGIIAFLFLR